MGTNSIRFVKVEQSGGAFRPQLAEVTLGPDLYNEGQVVDRRALGQAVRSALMQQFGSFPKEVAVALGTQGVLVRRVGLPKLKGAALRHLVETQGEQWIPFLREGAAFDLVVVDPDLSDHQQEVLLVAVPLRTLQRIYDVTSAAGLKLVALDLDTAALYRAAAAHGTPTSGVVGLVDLTGERARLALYQSGYLAGTRTLDGRGGRGATPWGQAGLPDDLPVDARRTIDLMVTQLRSATELGAVVVVGNPPPELMAAFDREFRTAMSGRITPGFSLSSVTEAQIPPAAAVGFGLALSGVVRPHHFDLLSRPTVVEGRHRALAWLLSGALALGMGGYGFLWSLDMPVLQSDADRLRTELGMLQNQLAREPQLRQQEARVAALGPIIGQLNTAEPWTVTYPRLKALLPAGVQINSISVQVTAATMMGTSPAPEQTRDLLNSLDQSPHFLAPALSTSSTDANAPFVITFQLTPREVKTK